MGQGESTARCAAPYLVVLRLVVVVRQRVPELAHRELHVRGLHVRLHVLAGE